MPRRRGRPIECRSNERQTALGNCAVRAVEREQVRGRAAGHRNAENVAVAAPVLWSSHKALIRLSVKLPLGLDPFVPLKVSRVVAAPPVTGTLKTVP